MANSPEMPDHTETPLVMLRWAGAQLSRPRVRTVLVGVLLLVIADEWLSHSVWTFPLAALGILMIVVAWVGSRLEGRFGIEWSEAGAGFEMRASFKAASRPPVTAPAPETAPVEETVIEGEAHTIEIDVEELRALVAAAERAGVATATPERRPVSWQETAVEINGRGPSRN